MRAAMMPLMPPFAQADREHRPHQPGAGEQRVAQRRIAAERGDRLAGKHHEAENDADNAQNTRARVSGSCSTRKASSVPPSAALAGWMTAPCPSGASVKPV